MLLLAASVAFLSGVGQNSTATRDAAAWAQIRPCVAVVREQGIAKGTAILIDSRGWFLAQNSVASGAHLQGRFFDGTSVNLSIVKVDSPTQLALLKSEGNLQDRPVANVTQGLARKANSAHPWPVLAILPSGPLRADVVAMDRLGVSHSSKAAMTFSEIQFESPTDAIGGAPVFSLDGSLVGILQATLGQQNDVTLMASPFAAASNKGVNVAPKSYGPQGMTVAYTPSPEVIQRVISGFLTESHEVQRPAIGVFCRNGGGHGALVESVIDGSPADVAGIRRGDLIVAINGVSIHGAIEFGRSIVQQQVGNTIIVSIQRSGHLSNLPVKVGM